MRGRRKLFVILGPNFHVRQLRLEARPIDQQSTIYSQMEIDTKRKKNIVLCLNNDHTKVAVACGSDLLKEKWPIVLYRCFHLQYICGLLAFVTESI